MQLVFHHSYGYGTIAYSQSGISIKPLFSRVAMLIPWSNIKFLSPTPAVTKLNDNWQTYDGRDLMETNALEALDFFYVDIVLKNRHELKMGRLSFWDSMIFRAGFPSVKPTYGADDKPLKEEGFIRIKIRKGTLNAPLSQLLIFLDKQTRYDLLCSDGG